jgi:hypothetical protein
MNVIIDGIEYVPKSKVTPPTSTALNRCIAELVSIQYFYSQTHKHRATAWDALNEIAPNIAEMCSRDSAAAFRATRINHEANDSSSETAEGRRSVARWLRGGLCGEQPA